MLPVSSDVGERAVLLRSHVVAVAPPANLTALLVKDTVYLSVNCTLQLITGTTVALLVTEVSVSVFVVAPGLVSVNAMEPSMTIAATCASASSVTVVAADATNRIVS